MRRAKTFHAKSHKGYLTMINGGPGDFAERRRELPLTLKRLKRRGNCTKVVGERTRRLVSIPVKIVKDPKLMYIVMNTEVSDLGQSSELPELIQCLPNGEALVIYNKHISDRFTVSVLHELEHTGQITDVQFSQDGKYIAATYNSTVVIYDLGTGEKIASLLHEGGPYSNPAVGAISFTSNAEHFLCALSTGNVTIWNLKSGAGCREEVALGEGGSGVFSRDGGILIWGVAGLIRIFDCEVGGSPVIRQRTVIRDHGLMATDEMTISADNKVLAS